MDKLLGFLNLTTLGGRGQKDDDFCDRLNHRYSTFILVIFAIVVTTRQYVGDPINCWAPAHFTSNYIDYTNKICWVSNTYYIPFSVINIPENREPKRMINYYQWVPMILMVQSLLFHLPHSIWKTLNGRTGVDVPGIVDTGIILQHINLNHDREKVLNYLAKQIDTYLVSTRDLEKGCCKSIRNFLAQNVCLFCGRRYGNYLMTLYLLVKFLYVVNAISQLFLLNGFLRTDYHVYGLEIMAQLLSTERDYPLSQRFPRVTLCDFRVRQLANTHRHTVQCVLPINLFNEKIFIFIWFWLVLMALLNIINLIIWLGRSVCSQNQNYFVKRHLRNFLHGEQDREDIKKLYKAFILNYLRQDGILVLRLMEFNSNSLVTAELVATLWRHFTMHKPNLRRSPSQETLCEV